MRRVADAALIASGLHERRLACLNQSILLSFCCELRTTGLYTESVWDVLSGLTRIWYSHAFCHADSIAKLTLHHCRYLLFDSALAHLAREEMEKPEHVVKELENYLAQQKIDKVVKEMVVSVLHSKPESIEQHM